MYYLFVTALVAFLIVAMAVGIAFGCRLDGE